MSIIYIISVITLFVSFLLLKKSEKKLDITSWVAISIVLLLCYNTFLCYMFTVINIPISLLTLAIINFIISTIFIIYISKGKRQLYIFKKYDIMVLAIIVVMTFLIAIKNFGFPLHINYITTDAGVHYNATHNFYKSDSLLGKLGNDMMAGAYSNAGIWLKIMAPIIDDIDLFNVYICFDIFMYFMTGVLMYVALKRIMNSIKFLPISIFITIIYMFGYPLNVLIFGYFYLQLGIIVFSTIVILMMYFKEDVINHKIMTTILFLLCYELFFSYYLFVPVIYGALGIYYIYYFRKKTNKFFNKEMIIYISLTLAIPCIIGFVYHILPGFVNVKEIKAVNIMSMEGYIYRNYITNILLFIPFILFYLIREKETDYSSILLLILILFMCLLYIGCYFEIVSTYYFYKTYFILWFLILYLFGCSAFNIVKNNEKGGLLINSFIILYLVLMMLSLTFQTVKINKSRESHETVADVMNIYGINKSILLDPYVDFTEEEIDILKYIENEIEINEDTDFMFLAEPVQEYWIWGMFNYKNRENMEERIKLEEIKKCNRGEKYDYIVYFNNSYIYNLYKDKFDFNKKVLFENESGGVLKVEK